MGRGKKNVAVTSQQAPECEMTVTNCCGYIAHGEKQKRNLLVWKRFLFKRKFYMVTASTVFIKSMKPLNIQSKNPWI